MARYPRNFGTTAARAQSRAAFVAVGGGSLTPIVGTLLSGFEALTEWTNSSSTLDASLDPTVAKQGVNALRFSAKPGTSGGNLNAQMTATAFNLSALGSVVFLSILDDDFDWQMQESVTMNAIVNGTGTVYPIATKSSLGVMTGPIWIAGKPTQSAITEAGVGSHRFRATSTRTSGQGAAGIALDAFYYATGGKGGFLWRFADAKVEAYTVAFPIMQAAGLVGELHLPLARIGAAGCLTWPMIWEMKLAGWSIQIDATADDTSITGKGTPANVVDGMLAQADELVARGYDRPIGTSYPFGARGTLGTRIEKASCNGTGRSITPSDATTGIVAGMRVVGPPGVTRTMRVDSVAGGVVTTNEPLTMDIVAGVFAFVDDGGAFHGNKMQREMKSRGWRYAYTTQTGTIFPHYGIPADFGLLMPSNPWTGMTLAAYQAAVSSAAAHRSIQAYYLHDVMGADFAAIVAWQKDEVAAGRMVNYTTPLIDQLFRNAKPPS